MKVSEVVEKYIEIRDRRAERKQRYNEEDAADEALQSKIEAKLLEVFDKLGTDSMKTPFGTAYRTTRSSCSVADKAAFMDYVRQNDEWPLLEVRPSKAAVEQYKAANDEALPPGVNWRSEVVVNIKRS